MDAILLTQSDRMLPGYHEVLYWRISGKTSRVVWMQMLALLLLVLGIIVFFGAARRLGKIPDLMRVSALAVVLAAIAGVFVTVILHELVHGIAMSFFGAHPYYGISWQAGAFYATAPGYAFQRWQYLFIAVIPLLGLSLLSFLGMWLAPNAALVGFLAWCAAFNFSGAAGDIWIASIVLRYPPAAMIMDEQDGVRIFLPDN